MIFESLGIIVPFHRVVKCLFFIELAFFLLPPLSPEHRPTGLVHLDKFKAKRVQDGLDSRIGIPRDDAVNDSQPSPSYTP